MINSSSNKFSNDTYNKFSNDIDRLSYLLRLLAGYIKSWDIGMDGRCTYRLMVKPRDLDFDLLMKQIYAEVVPAASTGEQTETATTLADPNLLSRVAGAEVQIRRGRYKSLEKLFPRRRHQ